MWITKKSDIQSIQVSMYPKKTDIHLSKYPCIQLSVISKYPLIQVSKKNQYPRYPSIRISEKSGIHSSLHMSYTQFLNIKTVWKRISLYIWTLYDHSWPFFCHMHCKCSYSNYSHSIIKSNQNYAQLHIKWTIHSSVYFL